jgi:predicted nucleic acid-binding protein
MKGKTFVDSNVLIYAHDVDSSRKQQLAEQVLTRLWAEGTGVLSVQVLQEFYYNATRKRAVPLAKPTARRIVQVYAKWCLVTTAADILAAQEIEVETHINFWDALIVATAVSAGAETILSEDLNPGQRIAGLLIENPFAAS